MSTESGFNIIDVVKNASEKIGIANVLIAGKTGVGKSTLINSTFQGNMAEVGQGLPVSTETKEITKEGIPIAFIDTRGLELEEYGSIIEDLEKYVQKRASEPNPSRHIHVAWLCIAEDSRRVERAEILMVKMLAQYMPVIAVILKARQDKIDGTSFKSTVERLLPHVRNVVRVRAIVETLDEGYTLPVMGLDKLVDLTITVIPEGQRNAFVAAQKVNIQQKIDRARLTVAGFCTIAAVSAAVPANLTPPGGHATLLVSAQVTMLATISLIFGLTIDRAFLGTLISGVVAGSIGTLGGREIFRRLVEFIPGAGIAMSAAIGAATASSITGIMGEAYTRTLAKLIANNANPTPEDISEAFKEELRQQKFIASQE